MDDCSAPRSAADSADNSPAPQARQPPRPAPTITVSFCVGGLPERALEPLAAALLRCRLATGVTRADTEGWHDHGERQAWAALAAVAQPRVASAVRAAGVPERERNECIQEAWLEVLISIRRVDPDPARGNVAGWLATVSRRAAWRHVRRQNRQPTVSDDTLDPPTDPGDDPAALVLARESTLLVRRLVAQLRGAVGPEAHALAERYMHSDTPRLSLMATELGITQGQLWHRWRTTLTHLQEQLENDFV